MTPTVPLRVALGSYKVSRASLFAVRVLTALLEHDPHGDTLPVSDHDPVDPLRGLLRTVRSAYCELVDHYLVENPDEPWPGQQSLAANRHKVITQAMEWAKPITSLFPPYEADTTAQEALSAAIAFFLARDGSHRTADIIGVAIVQAAASLQDDSAPAHKPSASAAGPAGRDAAPPQVGPGTFTDEDLLDYFHRLRMTHGMPSISSISTATGIEHTHDLFAGNIHKPQWDHVMAIVMHLDGDLVRAKTLWQRYLHDTQKATAASPTADAELP